MGTLTNDDVEAAEGDSSDTAGAAPRTISGQPLSDGASAKTLGCSGERRINRDWLQQLLRKHAALDSTSCHSSAEGEDKDDILRDKALVVAPMVDQSDLPFRLLCRRYGANLCYTPMIHARMFINNELGYKNKFWNTNEGTPDADRPLIVQFAGGDPDVLVRAGKIVENQCDAVDINCGCPQSIAKRGNYGAFLLEQEELLVKCVKAMAENVKCPVTVKVRLLPSGLEDSIKLYTRLVDAGASLLTVHGRDRFQKGQFTGAADWDAIRQVVDALGHRVPIIANGSCACLDDVRECLRVTGADGVMLSEAVLEYPPVFVGNSSTYEVNKDGDQTPTRTGPGRVEIAREYMKLCEKYPPDKAGQGTGSKCIKMHLHRFLHADLQLSTELRDVACSAQTYDDMNKFIEAVDVYQKKNGHQVKDEELSWYMRYRLLDENGHIISLARHHKVRDVPELDVETAETFLCLFGADEDNASY